MLQDASNLSCYQVMSLKAPPLGIELFLQSFLDFLVLVIYCSLLILLNLCFGIDRKDVDLQDESGPHMEKIGNLRRWQTEIENSLMSKELIDISNDINPEAHVWISPTTTTASSSED